MHFIFALFLSVLLGFAPITANADDFGARFGNQAPKGLGDYTAQDYEISDVAMDEAAKDLQDIMPASGEEVTEDAPTETQAEDKKETAAE